MNIKIKPNGKHFVLEGGMSLMADIHAPELGIFHGRAYQTVSCKNNDLPYDTYTVRDLLDIDEGVGIELGGIN